MSPVVPEVEGYEIGSPIGTGPRGEVFFARDRALERDVAIRFLPAVLRRDEGARAALAERLRPCLSLTHPNLVAVLEVQTDREPAYVVTEFVSGRSLEAVLEETPGPVPPQRAFAIAQGILTGLAALHSRGIVHGALRPDRILIEGEEVRLLEIGWPVTGPQPAHVDWIPPETMLGREADERSDLYQAGLVTASLLAGAAGADGLRLIKSLPPSLSRWLSRCSATNPSTRFATADEACQHLRAAMGQADQPRPAPRPLPRSMAHHGSRLRLLSAASLLVALVAAVLHVSLVPETPKLELFDLRHEIRGDRAVVTWQSRHPYVGRLRLQAAAGKAGRELVEAKAARRHRIALPPLHPRERLRYAVVFPDGTASYEQRFAAPPLRLRDWAVTFQRYDRARLSFTTNYEARAVLAGRRWGRPFRLDVSRTRKRSHEVAVPGIAPEETIDQLRVVLRAGEETMEWPVGRLRGPACLARDLGRAIEDLDPPWVARELLRHLDGGDEASFAATLEATRYSEATALMGEFASAAGLFFRPGGPAPAAEQARLYRALMNLEIIDGALASRARQPVLRPSRLFAPYAALTYPDAPPAGTVLFRDYERPHLLMARPRVKAQSRSFGPNLFAYVLLPAAFRKVAGVSHRFQIEAKALAKASSLRVTVVAAHLEPLTRLELRLNGKPAIDLYNTVRSFRGFCLDPREAASILGAKAFAPYASTVVVRLPATFVAAGTNRLSLTCRGAGPMQGCNVALFEIRFALVPKGEVGP